MVLCLHGSSVLAQNSKVLKVLDVSSGEPISEMYWRQGSESGVSNELGEINVQLSAINELQLSHISYGTKTLKGVGLSDALAQGVIKCDKVVLEINPVTIIGLHSSGLDANRPMDFSYQDRLSSDAGAVLTQMPEIAVIRKSGSYGFDPVLRGFKYDRLNIVMNGSQSAIAACPNRMDPPTSQVPTSTIQKVEVYKGPYALRYGAGFGGTINFVSEPLVFTTKPEASGRLSGSYESNGSIYRTEGKVSIHNPNYNLTLLGSLSQGKDYLDGNGDHVLANFKRSSLGAILGVKLSAHQDVKMSAINNMASGVDFPSLPMDLTSDDTWLYSGEHQIRFVGSALNQWNSSLYLTAVNHSMDNFHKPPPQMASAQTLADTYNYGGRTEGAWRWDASRLFAGSDVRFDEVDGTRTRTFLMGPNVGKIVYDNVWQEAIISKYAVFGEYQFTRSLFDFVVSSRLELNQADSRNSDSGFEALYPTMSATQVNPSVSGGLKYHVSNNFTSGLSLGRAQRSGGLAERYINYLPIGIDAYEMIGNPSLNPEVNNQLDVSFDWQFKTTKVGLTCFGSYLSNYISSVIRDDLKPKMATAPGVRQFVNVDKASVVGFEAVWVQALPWSLSHRLSVAYSQGEDMTLNEALPEMAPLDIRFALMGHYVKKSLVPELRLRYVAQQNRIATSYGETVSPSFYLVDALMAYHKRWFNASAGIYNVFNQAYYEHLNRSVRDADVKPIYAPGRSLVMTLSVSF